MNFKHQTVLLREAVDLLDPRPGKVIVDGTLGGGGHSEALLARGATVFGVDRDPLALAAASERLKPYGERFKPVQGEFGALASLFDAPVDGVLLDLGVSSPQLDTPERGFSFMNDGPLDMRMADFGETAAELVERLEADELANVIFQLGDERFSRPIARALKNLLPKTTREAVAAIEKAVPRAKWPKGIHVATRTFQALRMAVNDELGQLDSALAAIPSVLKPGGVAAIISFHSGEDAKVKQVFRQLCGQLPDDSPRGLPIANEEKHSDFEALTRKPITGADEEIENNPRARSAKLRGIRKKETAR